MSRKSHIIFQVVMIAACLSLQVDAQARKRLLPGRSDGMAVVTVAAPIAQISRAVKKVFQGDGYALKSESEGQLVFSRSAGKMKDLSYGGLAGSGSWEQVYIRIQSDGVSAYNVSCDVYMTQGDKKPSSMDTKVLKAFGKEYQRMLRRVKRSAEKGASGAAEDKVSEGITPEFSEENAEEIN